MSDKNKLHVHTDIDGGWCVRRQGRQRALRRGLSRDEALALAEEKSAAWDAPVVVHRRDGIVEEVRQPAKGGA